MPRASPLIQVPQAPKHTPQSVYHPANSGTGSSTSYMHQHTHQQHAFTPILHQSLIMLPAPVVAQDRMFNLPRGTIKPSFVPVAAFPRSVQKSFRSTKPGRWSALHVCIAWKIYYHKQLKIQKMQQKPKPKSLHQELTPEYRASSRPDSAQHNESDQPSCRPPSLDSPHGHSGKTAENISHFSRPGSSPAFCNSRTAKREKLHGEKLEQSPNLCCREKLAEKQKHRDHQTDTEKDLPLTDKSWEQTMTQEVNGGRRGLLDRKRQLECHSFIKVKRIRQGIVEDQFGSSKTLCTDPSPFITTRMHPSSHTVPVQHINNLSGLYPNSSRCNVTRAPGGLISYPGAGMHPYQIATWQPMLDAHMRMDLHVRQNVLKDNSLNTSEAIRIPLAAQQQKEASSHGVFMPPLYLPLALRQQETVYLRGRGFLHSGHEDGHLHHFRHQLPHPGFLTTSYLGS
ncbi:uncharacterized protein LOC123986329 isoform X2 [Micropterus dolomieu]|uniref:uncharacterized protein LOC123986329 isoform X2 n=1 Tax=Micropterus dolomieu TaxID=147949 RepID=UPI001E8D4899|nr:uncharacterized protein LOC123986329 isoform X2 [Micropterus dolomieu]